MATSLVTEVPITSGGTRQNTSTTKQLAAVFSAVSFRALYTLRFGGRCHMNKHRQLFPFVGISWRRYTCRGFQKEDRSNKNPTKQAISFLRSEPGTPQPWLLRGLIRASASAHDNSALAKSLKTKREHYLHRSKTICVLISSHSFDSGVAKWQTAQRFLCGPREHSIWHYRVRYLIKMYILH